MGGVAPIRQRYVGSVQACHDRFHYRHSRFLDLSSKRDAREVNRLFIGIIPMSVVDEGWVVIGGAELALAIGPLVS